MFINFFFLLFSPHNSFTCHAKTSRFSNGHICCAERRKIVKKGKVFQPLSTDFAFRHLIDMLNDWMYIFRKFTFFLGKNKNWNISWIHGKCGRRVNKKILSQFSRRRKLRQQKRERDPYLLFRYLSFRLLKALFTLLSFSPYFYLYRNLILILANSSFISNIKSTIYSE